MNIHARDLVGRWRQTTPPTGPDRVFIRLDADGRFVWIMESDTTLSLELTWAVRGNVLITQRTPEPPQEFAFRLEPPGELVLERGRTIYRYERCE